MVLNIAVMLLNQNDTVSHRGLWVDRKEKGIFNIHEAFGFWDNSESPSLKGLG